MEAQLLEAIDAIRPALQVDGGDMRVIEFDEATGRVDIELMGACGGCPMSSMTLKAGIERQKLNWRSFAHKESSAEEWNTPGTPGYYILDHKGVIRFKWVGNPGEKAMDSAIEKLLAEVGKKE